MKQMNEFEFLLEDRIAKIHSINEQYDLENNSYIAFSGGKDSTILSHLVDIALPNNKIPRVFINTGIEFQAIRKFVQELANTDDRFIILNNKLNIKKTLQKYGYPFKSKQHSHNLSIYQNGGLSRCVRVYLGVDVTNGGKEGYFKCPNNLKYQFTSEFTLKCSELCCKKMKKDPAQKWSKENNKPITI